jgi:hypothetical protein
VQRPVGVAVTATMQPIPVGLARTGGDGRGPAQVSEGCLSTQPLGALAGSGQQLPGVVDPIACSSSSLGAARPMSVASR